MSKLTADKLFLNFIVMLCVGVTISSCGSSSQNGNFKDNPTSLPDTLRIGTLYSPTTYFIYRDEPMGYEYDLAVKYAESQELPFSLTVAPNFNDLVELLDSGKIDLIACRVPMTSEYKELVRFCGPIDISTQVLVQRVDKESPGLPIDDVTDLVGKEVVVEENSKYYRRIKNLNEELGGGIIIKGMDADTLETRALVEMVSKGEIPMTVVDGDIALLEKTYYDNIDVSMALSLEQKSSWAVAKNNKVLADSIDKWCEGIEDNKEVLEIHRRYFEFVKTDGSISSSSQGALMLNSTTISKYDSLFKKYAPEINWDWRLLAAVCYVESRFDNNATSWAGASGIMQIMPRTGASFGLSASQLRDPENSVAVSVKILKALDDSLSKKILNSRERLKFVLASYNAGLGHILDAIALAEKYGKDKSTWDANVCDALIMKSRQEYYTDSVVKHGYFRANETVSFVNDVMDSYGYYKANAQV